MKAYKDQHKENENLAEIQEFKFDTPDKEVYIDFVGSEVSGKQSISVRTKERCD
jgi:hypothetical protein